jgi:hypothetical protein
MKNRNLFKNEINLSNNLIVKDGLIIKDKDQKQTQDTFSEKWIQVEKGEKKDEVYSFQKEWFLKLYGFSSQEDLKNLLGIFNQ